MEAGEPGTGELPRTSMHSERRWDLGSKRRMRRLRLRGNGPDLLPMLVVVVGFVVLWVLYRLAG